LLARQSDYGFSWEWYNKDNGNRFRQLQGGTAVEVNVSGRPFIEELVEVKFLDNTSLGFMVGRARDDTHKIIVNAGNVLRFNRHWLQPNTALVSDVSAAALRAL
jgi:hypothetical protein